MSVRRFAKGAMFTSALILLIGSVPQAFQLVYQRFVTVPDVADSFRYEDPQIRFIIENAIETSFSLLQSALLFIAAAWALLAVENEKVLKTCLERTLFIAGTLALVLSCYSYQLFYDQLIHLLQESTKHGDVPDLRHDVVLQNYYAQVFGIVSGAICIGMSIVHSKWIRGG